ncbi:hypothetical protein [Rhodococcus sp. T7]|uniref:hypothetical protein n=1 Tax=Rhodococcus sp. T7 TaxID=627444 RepID=UPI00135C0FB3|nr:hypothetical protein [Rhodococcus sp. T7]KAF0956803.1 hypothetical protein MLGJGCBP_09883 [Rhodococcus sp. T7]KAF0962085.1 hypothetical protein MLGJGCBP_04867 [Rhodococcus sp. T7]
MDLSPVHRRPGESNEALKIREKWASYANSKWCDQAAFDRIRSIYSSPPDWNIDENISIYARSALSTNEILNSGKYNPVPWTIRRDPPNVFKPTWAQTPLPPAPSYLEPRFYGSMARPPDLMNTTSKYIPAWSLPIKYEPSIDLSTRAPNESVLEAIADHASLNARQAELANFLIDRSGPTVIDPWDRSGWGPPRFQQQVLPMSYASVGKAIKRGAQLVWDNKKWVAKIGKHILGPVGLVGDAIDAARFIAWMHGEGVFDNVIVANAPRLEYQPGPQNFVFVWPDKTSTSVPQTWVPILS